MRKTGYVFTPFEAPNQSPFDKLFDVFSELITHTSGDVDEALDWLNILDKEYNLTSKDYTMEDFKAVGFDDFLAKPLNFDALVSQVKALTE
jgi:hypothetical protein